MADSGALILDTEIKPAITVGELLTASRSAHKRYRECSGRVDKDGLVLSAANDHECAASIKLALSMRLRAHKLDPKHSDPAWHEPRSTHRELVEFYERYLRQISQEKERT